MLSDTQKRKRRDESKENGLNMTTVFNRLKKCVPGTFKLSRPDIFIITANYIGIPEECIRKMRKENSKLPSPMDCRYPFSPVDLAVISSELVSLTPEEMQECTVPKPVPEEKQESRVTSTPTPFRTNTRVYSTQYSNAHGRPLWTNTRYTGNLSTHDLTGDSRS
jgi:hypothetical protein